MYLTLSLRLAFALLVMGGSACSSTTPPLARLSTAYPTVTDERLQRVGSGRLADAPDRRLARGFSPLKQITSSNSHHDAGLADEHRLLGAHETTAIVNRRADVHHDSAEQCFALDAKIDPAVALWRK
jgi:hypothetical protein